MKKHTYYRKRYLIGIYGPLSDGEPLIALCDNLEEFAEFMEIKKSCAKTILIKLFNKKTNFIRCSGKCCSVAFIKLDQNGNLD